MDRLFLEWVENYRTLCVACKGMLTPNRVGCIRAVEGIVFVNKYIAFRVEISVSAQAIPSVVESALAVGHRDRDRTGFDVADELGQINFDVNLCTRVDQF